MGRKDAFGIALKAVIVKDHQFLILKRSKLSGGYKDIWEFPGGGLEEGEKHEDALLREITEETGLQVKLLRPLSTWDARRKDGTQVVGITYLCHYTSGDIVLSEEHIDYAWITADDVDAYSVFPKMREEIKSWHINELMC